MSELLLDRAGRRRSPATMSEFRTGHAPGNKGLRYPADPPKVEEIIAVMRTAGDAAHGRRLAVSAAQRALPRRVLQHRVVSRSASQHGTVLYAGAD
jgi:hypothetical protein